MRWARVASRRSRPTSNGLAVAAEDDGDDPGVAGDAADGLHRQRGAAVGLGGAALSVGGGGVAVEEGVVVDQHHHPTRIGPRQAFPADQRVQGFSRDLGPLPVGDRLGAGRDAGGDLGVEGPVDGFAAEGVPFTVDALHAGHRVGELPGPGVAALLLEFADTVVAHDPVDPVTAAPLELADRQALGHLRRPPAGRTAPRTLACPDRTGGRPGWPTHQRDPPRCVPSSSAPRASGIFCIASPRLAARAASRSPSPALAAVFFGSDPLALLLQTAGPGRHLGQDPDQPGVHGPDLGTQPVDGVGRHARDLLLELADPGRDRDWIGCGDLDHVTVHRQRHHTPPCPWSTVPRTHQRAETLPSSHWLRASRRRGTYVRY